MLPRAAREGATAQLYDVTTGHVYKRWVYRQGQWRNVDDLLAAAFAAATYEQLDHYLTTPTTGSRTGDRAST